MNRVDLFIQFVQASAFMLTSPGALVLKLVRHLVKSIRSFSVGNIRNFFMETFQNTLHFQLLKERPNKRQTNFQHENTLQTEEVL